MIGTIWTNMSAEKYYRSTFLVIGQEDPYSYRYTVLQNGHIKHDIFIDDEQIMYRTGWTRLL